MDRPPIITHLKRDSNDVGWEYGVLCDPRNPDKVQCKLCKKEMSGGVFRIEAHISCLSSGKYRGSRKA